MASKNTRTLAVMGLFVALCYLGTLFNIPFSMGGARVMIHFGNTFCMLAALTLGGVRGGITGSLGMGLFDLTSAGFQIYVPQTIILKFLMGLICGLAYDKLKMENKTAKIATACTIAMVVNVILAPVGSYVTSVYLMGIDKNPATVFAAMSALPSVASAILGIVIATVLYKALEPVLKKVQQ